MKLTLKKISVMFAMIIAASLVFVSCKKDGGDDATSGKKVQTINLSESSLGILVGTTKTITATVLPANAKDKSLTWTSSNNGVATVSEGKVTAVKVGECTITAAAKDGSNVKAECKIKVTDKEVQVESISFANQKAAVVVGKTVDLVYTILPEEATNKEVEWSSDKPEIATVENGKVTGVKEGTAKITVTTKSGAKTAECEVTVVGAPVAVSGVTLEPQTVKLIIGGESQLTYKVLPENASNKEVTWESSAPTIATVVNGKVSALAVGDAVITVKTIDGNFTAKCNVTVKGEAFYNDFTEDMLKNKTVPALKIAERNLYLIDEYDNTNKFATGSVKDTKNSTYFRSDLVYSLNKKVVSVEGDSYHIPTAEEFNGVLPSEDFQFTVLVDKKNVEESIQIGKGTTPKTYYADYKNNTNGMTLGEDPSKSILYAIKMRPKGETDYSKMCAYRYQWKEYETDKAHIEIQVKYLGDAGKDIAIEEVASESFWTKSNITIALPACGRFLSFSTADQSLSTRLRPYNSTDTKECNQACYYWTSSLKSAGEPPFVTINEIQAISVNGTDWKNTNETDASQARPIRLFRD